jgi:predicted HTH transcriptional regulator
MNMNEFHELIQLRKEGRSLEFKQCTPWADKFKAKITKSILAFSNVRDGGLIVIGVEQHDGGSFDFKGMTTEHLETWNYDDMASYVSEFADPFADFSLERVLDGQNTFLVIAISEFKGLPVICKKDGSGILRRGAIYTRTYRKPESAEVPTQTELREILDLAIEKGIKALLHTASYVGLALPTGPSDSDRFNEQLERF